MNIFQKAKAKLKSAFGAPQSDQVPPAPELDVQAVATPNGIAFQIANCPGRPGIKAYRAWRKRRRKMRAESIRAHRS
jgi:hypothetical protein